MNSNEHVCLKIACAKLGMTIKKFILLASFEKMEKDWLAEKAYQTLKQIESGKD